MAHIHFSDFDEDDGDTANTHIHVLLFSPNCNSKCIFWPAKKDQLLLHARQMAYIGRQHEWRRAAAMSAVLAFLRQRVKSTLAYSERGFG